MWILVVIFFIGANPADSKILAAKDEAACKEGKKSLLERAQKQGLDLWTSECTEVKHSLLHKDRDS